MKAVKIQYKAKKVPTEAIQWTRDNFDEVSSWLLSKGLTFSYHEISSGNELIVYVDGLPLQINVNNWIIFFDTHNVISCVPTLFESTFEVIDEESVQA